MEIKLYCLYMHLQVRARTKIGYGNFSGGPLLIEVPADSKDEPSSQYNDY